MLKKIGLPMLAVAGILAFATPQKADARVRFGIGIGGPVYTAPVPVAPYAYPYAAPDYYATPTYPYDYGYAPYAYPYAAPYYGGGVTFGFGGHYGDHDRYERGRGWEGHGRGGGEHFGHGGRR